MGWIFNLNNGTFPTILMCPQPTILHLDSDQPPHLYMYQRILLFPLGR